MHLFQEGMTRRARHEDTLDANPDLGWRVVRERALLKLSGTYVIKPTARPKHAPMAIVGRNIPAGIWSHSRFNVQNRSLGQDIPSCQTSRP